MKFIGDFKKFNGKITEQLLKQYPDTIHLVDAGVSSLPDVDPKKCIYVATKLDCPLSIPLLLNSGIRHILYTDRVDFEQELKLSIDLIIRPESVLNQPVERISKVRPAIPQLKIDFTAMEEKDPVVKKFSQNLEKVQGVGPVKDPVLHIVDELFTNALYDAPTDQDGNRVFTKRDRTDKIKLSQAAPPQLFLFYDKTQALVGCSDPYGSFDLDKLLGRLTDLYKGEVGNVNMGPGGAGVGYRMMLENCSALYIIVEKKKMTFVCFTLLLGASLKTITDYPKNMHFVSF